MHLWIEEDKDKNHVHVDFRHILKRKEEIKSTQL